MFHDPDFTPIKPPKGKPTLGDLKRNYLEAFPAETYTQPTALIRGAPILIDDTTFLMDPPLIEELLLTRADCFTRDRINRSALSSLVDESSLFLAEGGDWRWQRRAVAPAFRHDNLLALVPVFASCAETLAAQWRAGGDEVEVSEAMTRTTFDVIARAVFGDPGVVDRDRFLAALATAFEVFPWKLVLAMLRLPKGFPHPGAKRMRDAIAYVHGETGKVLAARRASGQGADILSLLLNARDPESGRAMTDDELTANLFTFVSAGHETTAMGLSWALWLLAKDQNSQERLRAEVEDVAGARSIGAGEAERLVFTRQVLMETMRLFPSVPAIARQSATPTTLGGLKIKRGAPVVVAIWSLHRNERLWDDPAGFEPERFSHENMRKRHRFSYLPFGGGRRICVGMSFAMLEMATILATLIRDFRFSPTPGFRLELAPNVSMRPKHGLPLIIERLR